MNLHPFGAYAARFGIGSPCLCAEHVRQLGDESPLQNLMDVKC